MTRPMKVAVVREFGRPLVIEQVPEPGSSEILLKPIASCGCPTDIRAAKEDWPVDPVEVARRETERVVGAARINQLA